MTGSNHVLSSNLFPLRLGMVGSVCNPLAEIRKEKGIVYYKLRILSSRKTANQT